MKIPRKAVNSPRRKPKIAPDFPDYAKSVYGIDSLKLERQKRRHDSHSMAAFFNFLKFFRLPM